MSANVLIKKVTLAKGNPLIGEGFLVTVGLTDPSANVEINGVIGRSNYVQFETEGSHFINVTVSKGDVIEKVSRKVVVDTMPPGAKPLPIIWSVEDRYSPRTVGFSIPNMVQPTAQAYQPPQAASQPSPLLANYEWDFGDGTKGASEEGLIRHDYSDTLDRDTLHSTFDVSVKAYHSDGTVTSSMRTISVFNLYGYNKAVNNVICPRIFAFQDAPMDGNDFVCTMTLQNLEDDELTLNAEKHEWLSTQTIDDLTYSGPYSVGPPVSTSKPIDAIKTLSTISVQLVAPVHSAVALNTTEILRVPARSTVRIVRRFPQSKFTGGVFGVAVHLSGSTMCSDKPVKCSGYFEVKLPAEYGGPVFEPIVVSALNQLSRYARSTTFTHADITEAVRKDAISRKILQTPPPKPHDSMLAQVKTMTSTTQINGAQRTQRQIIKKNGASNGAGVQQSSFLADITAAGEGSHVMSSTPADTIFKSNPSALANFLNPDIITFDELPITLGAECDPDNVPDDTPEGTVCQLTGELAWRYVPGRILNAKKGDVILSPGGQGLVGQLLRRVTPPQQYSHSGIMTKNHIEIRHSTGSEDWLKDHPSGSFAGNKGVDGFDPTALKYLWPGTITQNIDQAYYGQYVDSPEGKQYNLSSFSFDPSRGNINTLAYPLVVKPQAFDETPKVRLALHSIADAALAINGHYRFYCYTKPEVALDPTYRAGADAGWAVGTLPTVCSSFVWLAAQHANVKLEGAAPVATIEELEINDTIGGAEIAGDTLDGLYHYSAEERQAAAQWLYQTIYDEAHDKAGFWGTLFTDAPDNVANQLCNTFASDWVDGDSINSNAWSSTGPANAVSPDNILFWDSPGFGNQQGFHSVYGYREEAFFRPGTYMQVPIYRWKHVDTRGSLTGRVIALPSPEGANVSLLGSGQSDFPVHDDGAFHFDNVPAGPYTVTAGLNISGYWASDDETVEIVAGKTTDITLVLKLDPGTNRLVNFVVHMDTTNYAFADTDVNGYDMAGSVRVGPYHANGSTGFDGGGDNPHGHISFDVALNPDLSVNVSWTAQEVSDEVETELKHTVTIPRDSGINWSGLTVINDDPVDADNTVMRFTINNDQAPV